MNMTDFLHLPFVEVLKLLVKGSVEEYLAEKEATSSTANQTAAKTECESLDMKGALDKKILKLSPRTFTKIDPKTAPNVN